MDKVVRIGSLGVEFGLIHAVGCRTFRSYIVWLVEIYSTDLLRYAGANQRVCVTISEHLVDVRIRVPVFRDLPKLYREIRHWEFELRRQS